MPIFRHSEAVWLMTPRAPFRQFLHTVRMTACISALWDWNFPSTHSWTASVENVEEMETSSVRKASCVESSFGAFGDGEGEGEGRTLAFEAFVGPEEWL